MLISTTVGGNSRTLGDDEFDGAGGNIRLHMKGGGCFASCERKSYQPIDHFHFFRAKSISIK